MKFGGKIKKKDGRITKTMVIGNKFYGKSIRIKGLRKDEVIDGKGKIVRMKLIKKGNRIVGVVKR